MKRKVQAGQAVKIAMQRGIVRSRELETRGIARATIQRLREQGLLQRLGRGIYAAADAEPTEHHTLAVACKRVPHGVLCLLSALRFHDLGTSAPHEVWMAIKRGSRTPRVDSPTMRFFHVSSEAFAEGIEEREIEGVRVRVYSPAKTIADCFKYRNKIGLDIALEALRDCRMGRCASNDELWECARICRVQRVMKPYLEAIG